MKTGKANSPLVDDNNEFLRQQLKYAHDRNNHTDNHRFAVARAFLVFCCAVVAMIFKLDPNSSHFVFYGLPLIVGIVGLALFGLFLSQDLYMHKNKACIKYFENRLLGKNNDRDGFYRRDRDDKGSSPSRFCLDSTASMFLLLFISLNILMPTMVAFWLGSNNINGLIIAVCAAVSNLGVFYFVHSYHWRAWIQASPA